MLQWTGGSRRKVATSRKSTYNRQRQYFEQKKRQQQTCRPQNYEYGRKNRIDDNEGSRSLDVLNLKSFTSAPQCCSNNHNGDNIPQLISDVPTSLPAFQSNKTFPKYCYQPKNTRSLSNSCYEVQTQNMLSSASNLDKQQSMQNHCDGVDIRFGERKTQIISDSSNTIKYGVCVLDLLNDDGYQNNSSISSSHEAHVAFSVEGLGKIGIETPVCSPTQTARVSFDDLRSCSKSSRWLNNSDNDVFVPDDIGIEFDLGENPKFLGKSNIMNTHSGTLTSLNFRKDEAYSDVFSNLTSKTSFGKRKGIYKPALCRNEGTHKDRFYLINQENNKATWKDELFYINNNPLTSMEDKKSKMYINEFEDIYWRDRRNRVGTHEDSGSSEKPAPSFNHLRMVKDQDLGSFDWERYPMVNQALHFEDTTEFFSWSFPDTKDAVDKLNFQSDESSFLETDWHEGTSSSRSKSVNIERNNYDNQNKFWMRSDKEYGAENILLEKIKYDKLDGIENDLEGMWTNSPSQKKSMQGDFWKKLDCWPSFEEWFDVDLVPSPLLNTCQLDGAFFDSGILLKDDPSDVFQENTAHHPIDYSHRVSKSNVRAKQDTPDGFFSEENNCKRQKSEPINLMMAPSIYPFKANDENESDFLFSLEVNRLPDPSIQKNLNKDNDDSEPGFLSTTCHENSQEHVSSVGESDFSSKTFTVLGSADNCTKDKKSKQEIPEGLSRSDSPKSESPPHSVGTPLVNIEEPLKTQENLISNASNDHIVSAPGSLPIGDKGKETLNANEENVSLNISSKELVVEAIKPSGSEDSAYKVMLESYVLQLLCVQKVLMNSSSVQDKGKEI